MAIGQLVHGPLPIALAGDRPCCLAPACSLSRASGCALAPSIEFFTVMRLLQALGGCAGIVVARAVVRDLFAPHETARIFSLMILIFGVAPILAPLVGGFLLTFTTWRTIFWILSAYGALMFLAVTFLLPESRLAYDSDAGARRRPHPVLSRRADQCARDELHSHWRVRRRGVADLRFFFAIGDHRRLSHIAANVRVVLRDERHQHWLRAASSASSFRKNISPKTS